MTRRVGAWLVQGRQCAQSTYVCQNMHFSHWESAQKSAPWQGTERRSTTKKKGEVIFFRHCLVGPRATNVFWTVADVYLFRLIFSESAASALDRAGERKCLAALPFFSNLLRLLPISRASFPRFSFLFSFPMSLQIQNGPPTPQQTPRFPAIIPQAVGACLLTPPAPSLMPFSLLPPFLLEFIRRERHY